jgi:hypothetical protein
VIGPGNIHGTVLKRVKRDPVVCYIRDDDGVVKAVREPKLRPAPVVINLAAPLYKRRRKKRQTGVKTSGTSSSLAPARFTSGGRPGSKR